MKSIFQLLILLILFMSYSAKAAYTVVIDPGHGGDDRGAVAKLSHKLANGKVAWQTVYEKDVVLQLAKRVHAELNQMRYKSYLTRSLDRYVTLQARADIAEQVQADLFVSLHLNSALSSLAAGFETYYLDNHTDAAVKKVEEVENRTLKGDELVIQQILIDLVVERTAKTSKVLAESIHRYVKVGVGKSYKMSDRQARAGMFYVLALAKRPAVLIESGFMSNQSELRKLLDPKFQAQLAKDIAIGIDKFMQSRQVKGPALF